VTSKRGNGDGDNCAAGGAVMVSAGCAISAALVLVGCLAALLVVRRRRRCHVEDESKTEETRRIVGRQDSAEQPWSSWLRPLVRPARGTAHHDRCALASSSFSRVHSRRTELYRTEVRQLEFANALQPNQLRDADACDQ